jgi:hypothetical protein
MRYVRGSKDGDSLGVEGPVLTEHRKLDLSKRLSSKLQVTEAGATLHDGPSRRKPVPSDAKLLQMVAGAGIRHYLPALRASALAPDR